MTYTTSGNHIICDMWGVNSELLNDGDFLMEILHNAARLSSMTVIGSISHKFEPQGFTGILLLAESHLSIHSYPEQGFVAIDCYTCGSSNNLLAIDYLKNILNPEKVNEQNIIRGVL